MGTQSKVKRQRKQERQWLSGKKTGTLRPSDDRREWEKKTSSPNTKRVPCALAKNNAAQETAREGYGSQGSWWEAPAPSKSDIEAITPSPIQCPK